MPKPLIAVAIYLGEVATLRLLAESEAAYEGWGFYAPASFANIAASCIVLSAISLLLSSRPVTIRDYFYWWAFATILVPAWVVAGWTAFFPDSVETRGVQLVTCGLLFSIVLSRMLPAVRMKRVPRHRRQLVTIAVVALALSICLLVFSLGLPDLRNVSLGTAYVRRAEFSARATGLTGYVMTWTSFVIVPTALLVGLRLRRPVVVFAAITVGLCVYAWVGTKNSLIIVAMTIALYVIVKRQTTRLRFLTFPVLLTALALVPPALAALAGRDELLYYVGRRALLVPSWNMIAHLQLGLSTGQEREGYWLLEAISGQGADPSIRGSVAVGEMLDPGNSLNANSHFLSYSMQWDSMLAVILVGILAAVVLWMLDSIRQGKDELIAVPLGAVVAFNLSEFYLHTALITGGILLAMLVLWLLPDADPEPGSRPVAATWGRGSNKTRV